MYKNSKGMSRLDGDHTGLSLPPLEGPSPRMSIVNEGLSSKKRNSRLESLRAGSNNGSVAKRSSQNLGF